MNNAERRRFLKVVSAAGLTTATMPMVRMAMAQSSPKRRAIFVYTPDGCHYDSWHPKDANTPLPPMTAPLERVRQHITFLKGMKMYGPSVSHDGAAKLFTGRGDGNWGKGTGPSLDYTLGQVFQKESVVPFINLNIVPMWFTSVSFDNSGAGLTGEPNPLAAYKSLFGNGQATNVKTEDTRGLAMVDSTRREIQALRNLLGADEKIKLEAHLQSLNELEHKIQAAGSIGSCGQWNFNPKGFKVTRDYFFSDPEYKDAMQMDTIADLHADILVHALACGVTRVATLKWNQVVNAVIMYPAGVNVSCHGSAHDNDPNYIKIKAWYMKKFAELIDRLKAVPEGNGTLLDNTIIFHGSELGRGDWHNHDNMPFFIAGGSAGGVKGNRVLEFKDEKHNKILVSIARFMGHNINQIGDQDPNGGPLPGLVA
jgi:hypothetical protein